MGYSQRDHPQHYTEHFQEEMEQDTGLDQSKCKWAQHDHQGKVRCTSGAQTPTYTYDIARFLQPETMHRRQPDIVRMTIGSRCVKAYGYQLTLVTLEEYMKKSNHQPNQIQNSTTGILGCWDYQWHKQTDVEVGETLFGTILQGKQSLGWHAKHHNLSTGHGGTDGELSRTIDKLPEGTKTGWHSTSTHQVRKGYSALTHGESTLLVLGGGYSAAGYERL